MRRASTSSTTCRSSTTAWADVRVSPEATLDEPDIVWRQDGPKSVTHDGRRVTFTGDWAAGPLQKTIVAVLALKMEDIGLHPSHSTAVHYRGKTFQFLGGESNRGKSMCLIEAGARGGLQVASETTVIDEDGRAVMGSVDVFLRKRTEGTERSDKAAPNKGVVRFWGDLPTWDLYEGTPNIDLVIVPMLDGNSDPATNELGPFERQFQFLHSLQNYLLTNELLARVTSCRSSTPTSCVPAGPASSPGSASGRSSSSAPPRHRSSWTRWTASSRARTDAAVRLRPTGDAGRGRRPARGARPERPRCSRAART